MDKYSGTRGVGRLLSRMSASLAGLFVLLALASCSRGLATASHITNPAASVAKLSVTSTLDGRTALPQRIHWQAFPSAPPADVFAVDFLIDGKLGWEERVTPYFYGNDGNWLVTSFLAAGTHTFVVRVITTSGQVATDAVTASVNAALDPPAALAGTWTRVVTAADVQKATSGQPLWVGRWQLQIAPIGWHLSDPAGGSELFDVSYQSSRDLQMRPGIDYPPYPKNDQGGFCDDTDPLWAWTYVVVNGGKALSLNPVGHDPCGDRTAILAGTWTRTSTQ